MVDQGLNDIIQESGCFSYWCCCRFGWPSSDIEKTSRNRTEIVSLAKSLSNISSTSYREKIGCSVVVVEEEKREVNIHELACSVFACLYKHNALLFNLLTYI